MSNPQDKITNFKPRDLEAPKGLDGIASVKAFSPRNLGAGEADYAETKKKFGSLANTDPGANIAFQLNPEAKKMLGVEKEERGHLAGIIAEEVETRINAIKEQAYQEGFVQGQRDGKDESEKKVRAEMQPAFEGFTVLMKEFDGLKNELYVANEAMIVQMVLTICKQLLLRDLKSDSDYVKRLTAQVIERVGAKDFVRIKLNSDDYKNVEQLRDFLKTQFPDLKNIQIEIGEDLPLGGCKIETDLARVNASFETQFEAIRKTMEEL